MIELTDKERLIRIETILEEMKLKLDDIYNSQNSVRQDVNLANTTATNNKIKIATIKKLVDKHETAYQNLKFLLGFLGIGTIAGIISLIDIIQKFIRS